MKRADMKRRLYIFGAAGFAVETIRIAHASGDFEVVALVEADSATLPEGGRLEVDSELTVNVIRESDLHNILASTSERLCGAIAIANPNICRKIVAEFGSLLDWPALIHPTAIIDPAATVGRGVIVYPQSIVSWRAEIGSFSKLQAGVTVGHEAVVGEFCELNPRATISGRVTIGSDSLIGASAVIRQGISVGENSTVGMGGVVVKSVEPGVTVVGNPAKPLSK